MARVPKKRRGVSKVATSGGLVVSFESPRRKKPDRKAGRRVAAQAAVDTLGGEYIHLEWHVDPVKDLRPRRGRTGKPGPKK